MTGLFGALARSAADIARSADEAVRLVPEAAPVARQLVREVRPITTTPIRPVAAKPVQAGSTPKGIDISNTSGLDEEMDAMLGGAPAPSGSGIEMSDDWGEMLKLAEETLALPDAVPESNLANLFKSQPVGPEGADLKTALDVAKQGTRAEGIEFSVDTRGAPIVYSNSPSTSKFEDYTAELSPEGTAGNTYSFTIGTGKRIRGNDEGTVTYQAVYAHAAKTGKVIVPDVGLSAMNTVRKSQQVASSYLKEGKSAHVVPDAALFSWTLDAVDNADDVSALATLDKSVVQYAGKRDNTSFANAKIIAKNELEYYDKESKVVKEFDKYSDEYKRSYDTYYNPSAPDSPVVAQQRANNLLVANMAALAKVALGKSRQGASVKSALSSKNKEMMLEFTADMGVRDPSKFNWESLMVPVGSDGKLPFLEWLGKAAMEGRLGKGTLPAAVIGSKVATELFTEEEGDTDV